MCSITLRRSAGPELLPHSVGAAYPLMTLIWIRWSPLWQVVLSVASIWDVTSTARTAQTHNVMSSIRSCHVVNFTYFLWDLVRMSDTLLCSVVFHIFMTVLHLTLVCLVRNLGNHFTCWGRWGRRRCRESREKSKMKFWHIFWWNICRQVVVDLMQKYYRSGYSVWNYKT